MEAEKQLREAVKVWESLRAGLGSRDDFKVSIFEQQSNTYEVGAAGKERGQRGEARKTYVYTVAQGGLGGNGI